MTNRFLSLLVCLLVVVPPQVCTCAMVTVHCHDSHDHLLSQVPADHEDLCDSEEHEHSDAAGEANNEPAQPSLPHKHRHHEPSCPGVHGALDREFLKVAAENLEPPAALVSIESRPADAFARTQPLRPVRARASGPPLYLTLQVLLI